MAAPGDDCPMLVLENGAGGGFGLGVTLDELERINEAVISAGIDRSRFGFCLDTAHACRAPATRSTRRPAGRPCWTSSTGGWAWAVCG